MPISPILAHGFSLEFLFVVAVVIPTCVALVVFLVCFAIRPTIAQIIGTAMAGIGVMLILLVLAFELLCHFLGPGADWIELTYPLPIVVFGAASWGIARGRISNSAASPPPTP